MLDENATGMDPNFDNDTLRKPLVAVFPHPMHGRLAERVVLMVSHAFNYKGIRYRFIWKDRGVAYYAPEAEETVSFKKLTSSWQIKKGQMSLPFSYEEADISAY
jgi:hypothetical protein